MANRKAILAVVGLMLVGTIGCAFSSRLDENWGRSHEKARHAQILNPDADNNLKPVEGIEGSVAERILEKRAEGREDQPSSSAGSAFGQ